MKMMKTNKRTFINSAILNDNVGKIEMYGDVYEEIPIDWWTGEPSASRYNTTSAIATINSLPDASAYLATAGGTNTIKFPNTLDFQNNLPEETIALAASKGWTISLGAVYA